ncbi:MAG: holin family protein [Rhodobacteraceae bacterium]|nr:holin family protein [Paracoccaceae bacterium]
MGLIRLILTGLFGGGGAGARAAAGAVREVAEVFTPNATAAAAQAHEARGAALAQHGAEFAHARTGRFDRMVDGLNRLPRPAMALGTLGLFVYAMADPAGFGTRMEGLATVPEPLWWLRGAGVAFYFGARELYHRRCSGSAAAARHGGAGTDGGTDAGAPEDSEAPPFASRRATTGPARATNPALAEGWQEGGNPWP